MRKLFIHQPLFRLLSPVISGIIIYLLVLLLNNNVEQIQEQFFNEELYFCIALSYLIQEFSRGLLVLFKRFLSDKLSVINILLQIIVSMILCLVISTIAINLYFKYLLNFSVTSEEIFVFDIIFCVVTFIYITLYISHQYLFKINSEKLHKEELIKKNIEHDFKQFKREINPNLLFDSFESLLILIKKNKENSDDFIDHLASIYRYILSGQEKELINFKDEIKVVKELIQLFNYLPYKNVTILNNCTNPFLIVPGSLLFIIEQIVRTSIISSESIFQIKLIETIDSLEISYLKNDKITTQFNLDKIKEIVSSYTIYCSTKIKVLELEKSRKIIIPKLKLVS